MVGEEGIKKSDIQEEYDRVYKYVNKHFNDPKEVTAFLLGAVVSWGNLKPFTFLTSYSDEVGVEVEKYKVSFLLGFYSVKIGQLGLLSLPAILEEILVK